MLGKCIKLVATPKVCEADGTVQCGRSMSFVLPAQPAEELPEPGALGKLGEAAIVL